MHFGFALTVNGNKTEIFMNKKSFTMADRRSSRFHISGIERIAFTMAEILLSLTIIGVVAAITLPSLTGNINEKTWNTQRKALYARMSQAIALMPYINGYGVGQTNSDTKKNAAKAFVQEGLKKVLKINNICDNQHLKDCGFIESIKTVNGNAIQTPQTIYDLNQYLVGNRSVSINNMHNGSFSLINIDSVAFETANGESILTFYQPYCMSKEILMSASTSFYPSQPYMCANFIYDLNGKKGPNTFGKDVGAITVLYPINSVVVAPDFFTSDINDTSPATNTNNHAIQICREAGGRLPTLEDGMSMFYNYRFWELSSGKFYRMVKTQQDNQWAKISTVFNANYGGYITYLYHNVSGAIRCIKK